MKILLSILLIMPFKYGLAQDPLGVYIDIDGKVKFWEDEANFNGNLDDTVIVRIGSKTYLEDLRNIKYLDLTLLEVHHNNFTSQTTSDPSLINDTTSVIPLNEISDYSTLLADLDYTIISIDTSRQHNIKIQESIKNQNTDIIAGIGITDSILQIIKFKLVEFIDNYYGKTTSVEDFDKLYVELSNYDTIIDKIAIYDYLVDHLVLYDYNNKNQLIRVIRYHWLYGVEVNYLKYDNQENIIYFSKEEIGFARDELILKYNSNMRVTNVIHSFSYSESLNKESLVYPDIKNIKFRYNELGIINSKSILQEDKSWLTYKYEIM